MRGIDNVNVGSARGGVLMIEDMELELDVAGVGIPSWLASRPDQVTKIVFSNADGPIAAFTFEAFTFSGNTTVHCTYPRYASSFTEADPQNECPWSHSHYDVSVMEHHARSHL